MLPTAGFFARFDCPFNSKAFCERPFCHYKHANEDATNWQGSGARNTHPVLKKEGYQKANVGSEKDPHFLQLEQINKQIESVKYEMEKEKRRLSCYETQGDFDGASPNRGFNPLIEFKDGECNVNLRTTCTSGPSIVHEPGSKYIVEICQPKTDLEYDPLSNYSADLQFKSPAEYKLQLFDGEDKPNLKRAWGKISEQQKESRPGVGDSDDEGVLVIDIPPLEDNRKKHRSQKLDTITSKMESTECISSMLCVPESLGGVLPPQAEMCTHASSMKPVDSKCINSLTVEKQQQQYCKGNVLDVFEDISKCLESLRSESNKIIRFPEPELIVANNSCLSEGVRVNSLPCHSREQPAKCARMPLNYMESQSKQLMDTLSASSDLQPNLSASPVTSQVLMEKPHSSAVNGRDEETQVQKDFQQGTSQVENNCLSVQHVTMASTQKLMQFNSVGMFSVASTESPSSVVPLNQRYDDQQMASDCHQPKQQLSPNHNIDGQTNASSTTDRLSEGPLGTLLKIPAESFTAVDPASLQGTCDQNNESDASSAEEDYLNMELSDSDPMEECYRIFMEENQAKPAHAAPSNTTVEAVIMEKTDMKKSVNVPGPKKRVAHVSKHEQLCKSKQQVIVPCRRAGPLLSNSSKLQQLQQKATVLTAAVKGAQAFVAGTNGHKKVENVTTVPLPTTAHPTCLNFLPVGDGIQWTNVHFIIPEGTVAVPVNPLPTPPCIPVIHQTLPASQHTTLTPAKPISVRRKSKICSETGTKVPHEVRQRYVNLFVEEFLKTSYTVQDAFEKALAEEKTIYERSVNKLKYFSVAVNVLKKLKNQSTSSSKANTQASMLNLRGHVAFSRLVLLINDPGVASLYTQLREHVLSEAQLKENNYPLTDPEFPGRAMQHGGSRKGSADSLKRICCRCGTTFAVNPSGSHFRKEECNYHSGKVVENKVPGGMETRYSCCEGAIGTPGCQAFKLHVHDAIAMEGFMSSCSRSSTETGCPGVFALNCDVCYTTHGLELARVTVVNSNLQVIYDTFVKPDNEIIDYNTRFSGIGKEDLSNANSSIRDVQEVLLRFVSADTILIGHSLENDLCALKFIHHTVVDTALVFPHRLGLPYKRELHSLVADHLRRIIQESDGHDSGEDAVACMELMLWKMKEDSKMKRW